MILLLQERRSSRNSSDSTSFSFVLLLLCRASTTCLKIQSMSGMFNTTVVKPDLSSLGTHAEKRVQIRKKTQNKTNREASSHVDFTQQHFPSPNTREENILAGTFINSNEVTPF